MFWFFPPLDLPFFRHLIIPVPLVSWSVLVVRNFNMMLGSGTGAIGGTAAGFRADVGGDNTHWIAGEGWRQASTVLLYPQVRIDAYKVSE